MNGTFENMIKRYSEELMKMSKEKTLPDPPVEETPLVFSDTTSDESADDEEADREAEPEEAPVEESVEKPRNNVAAIPDSEEKTIPGEEADYFPPFTLEDPTDYANFTARVFTGNSAYPIENARVLVIKDDKLFTFLSTDSDGRTKRVKLPSYPEINSLEPESNEQSVEYEGEVYAEGFTPKKGLLISAVGGSDIVLNVQMTPIDERVK